MCANAQHEGAALRVSAAFVTLGCIMEGNTWCSLSLIACA